MFLLFLITYFIWIAITKDGASVILRQGNKILIAVILVKSVICQIQ